MRGTSDSSRVWLVTGASRGLGRAVALAALAAGDRVAALSRTVTPADFDEHDRVLTVVVDVTDRSAVFAAVGQVLAHFGRLDVVVNNAGTMWSGFVEEFDEAQARDQLETNFFGALWVSQAVAPVLRAQGSGRLLQISSVGGLLAAPTTGLYAASKFALEGMSEALAAELAPFGVRVTIVEPGGYWTDLYRSLRTAAELPAYDDARAAMAAQWAGESLDSDPRLAAVAVLAVVDHDDPPLRLVLGDAVLDAVIAVTEERVRTWRSWEAVSRAAEHAVPESAVRGIGPGDDTVGT